MDPQLPLNNNQVHGIVSPSQPIAHNNAPQKSVFARYKVPILVGGLMLFILLILIALLVVGASNKKSKQLSSSPQNVQADGPQPANAIGIEQTSNSISQDISGLNDDKDIPSTMLDDRQIGL
ncbi:MAG: hypothetical protein NVSMB46_02560 [Candidatus Saccharimonadales bacterium]